MSESSTNPPGIKMLPDAVVANAAEKIDRSELKADGSGADSAAPGLVVTNTAPSRQLSELPRDELNHLATEFGLDPSRFKSQQALVAAIHERRQLIASMDREAMLDVIRWGRRPITVTATRDQIAQEIVRIRSMKFGGLSKRGLLVLAQLRNLDVSPAEPIATVVHKLRRQEGLFARANRMRRSILGAVVGRLISGPESGGEYHYLPGETNDRGPDFADSTNMPPQTTIRDDIEEAGIVGGITHRLRKSADQFLNQKLDEIEARIDRKLDEIDRRLAEWRDKEIANRIRILKITLWASVVFGVCTLLYAYVKTYIRP